MCKVETCILAFSGVEGIYPFRTCESCLQPTGEWYQQHPRRQGREGREEDPLVKRRLLENWGRLLGHSSFRQRRMDRTGRRVGRVAQVTALPLKAAARRRGGAAVTFHSSNWTRPRLGTLHRSIRGTEGLALPFPSSHFSDSLSLRGSLSTFIKFPPLSELRNITKARIVTYSILTGGITRKLLISD